MSAEQAGDPGNVELFRTIFFWPLTLEQPEPLNGTAMPDLGDAVDNEVKHLLGAGLWKPVIDPLDHIQPHAGATKADIAENQKDSYAEYAYFHDFVQHFLFRKADEPKPSFRLLRRGDVQSVDVVMAVSEAVQRFSVLRLNLYVLRAGVAILVLEVEAEDKSALSLHQCMIFNDRFRRAHAPFLDVQAGQDESKDLAFLAPGGFVPASVQWRGAEGAVLAHFETGEDVADLPRRLKAMSADARKVPPFRHWQWLLNGAQDVWHIGAASNKACGWRHTADDRLPVHSTIALRDEAAYRHIPDGDWMRLAFVDAPGSDPYPYAKTFLEETFAQHCYDRYHHLRGATTDAPVRFLMTSYAQLAVGSGWFFTNFIAMHMRRHYFQLMLLAQIEQAALLSFSSRITRAVTAEDRDRSEERLAQRLNVIERDLLLYVHRYRFTGVSTQLQPSEMFQKLRDRMGLEKLYGDVKDELETANGFLATNAQSRQTEATTRLSVIATLGVLGGLAFSFLGMNVFSQPGILEHLGFLKNEFAAIGHIALIFLTLSFFTLGGYLFLRKFDQNSDRQSGMFTQFENFLAVSAAILFALFLVLYFNGTGLAPDLPKKMQLCDLQNGKLRCATDPPDAPAPVIPPAKP